MMNKSISLFPPWVGLNAGLFSLLIMRMMPHLIKHLWFYGHVTHISRLKLACLPVCLWWYGYFIELSKELIMKRNLITPIGSKMMVMRNRLILHIVKGWLRTKFTIFSNLLQNLIRKIVLYLKKERKYILIKIHSILKKYNFITF